MQEKIKVVHIITRLILGGAQENTLLTVEGLSKISDYEVTLFTGPPLGPEGSLVEEAKEKGLRLIVVDCLRRNIHPWLDFKSFFKLYSLLRTGSYHIVHTHSSKAGILGRIAAWCTGVPIIIHTIHGLPFFPYQNKFMNFITVNLERITALFTDKIITVCDNMAKKAHKAKVAPLNKFLTIYSGMALDEFLKVKENKKLKESLGIKDNELVIGKIARLFELKGHRFLLKSAKEVIAQFPNIHPVKNRSPLGDRTEMPKALPISNGVKFLLIGDGILKDKLEKQALDLGIADKIIFAGLISREKIPDYISVMDIVVHVSLREGLARAIPQALACGKPVVSFDIDGADEIIKDGQNGFLLPAPDISEEKWSSYDCEQLTYSILKLLSDENLRKKMAEEGRKVVDPIFRAEYMVEKIDDLYKKLLKEKRIRTLD